MNILIVTSIYHISGRERLRHNSSAVHYLIRPWAQEHNVVVIHLYMGGIRQLPRYLDARERAYYRNGYFYESDGVRVAMCEVQHLPKQPPLLMKWQNQKLRRFTGAYLKRIAFQPDVIAVHIPTMTVSALEGMFDRVPKIAFLHCTDQRFWSTGNISERIQAKFDFFYARSETLRIFFEREKLRGLRQEVVSSGVPLPERMPPEKEKPACFRVLYVGRLIKSKHVELIIRALAELKGQMEFQLDIYGEGPKRHALQRLATKRLKGACCTFHGAVPRAEVFEAMEAADIFVMPSVNETLGLVYLEAMSRGCITIGTKGEGIDGILKDGENGFLTPPNDIHALKEIFRRIAYLPVSEYRRIQKNAYETGRRYNERDMAYRYLELLLRAVKKDDAGMKNPAAEEPPLNGKRISQQDEYTDRDTDLLYPGPGTTVS